MKLPSFLRFVGPSVGLMVALMAVPLAMTFYLSLRQCALEMETVTVTQSGPFGQQEVTTQRTKTTADGVPISQCSFVGLQHYKRVLGLDRAGADDALAPATTEATTSAPVGVGASKPANEFFSALRFTLSYIAATTPFVVGIGLLLALGAQQLSTAWRAIFITAALLPFIVTPVVAALSIKWLFRDNGLIPYLFSHFGVQVFWMAEAWSAQLLIVLYGVWHSVPFAFIVLFAGLQSVPQDSLEAATIDGASRMQRFRYVTLPHIMPLVIFILLIHVMDAYRVFEPIIVLTQGTFTTSVQYLTYYILLQESNPYKASAASVLTIAGVAVLLIPLLLKTYREQRGLN